MDNIPYFPPSNSSYPVLPDINQNSLARPGVRAQRNTSNPPVVDGGPTSAPEKNHCTIMKSATIDVGINDPTLRRLQEENVNMRAALLQVQDDFCAFQNTFESISNFYKRKLLELEDRIAAEVDDKHAALKNIVFLEDKVPRHPCGRYSTDKEDENVLKSFPSSSFSTGDLAQPLYASNRATSSAGPDSSQQPSKDPNSRMSVTKLPTDQAKNSEYFERVLQTREDQLERLARQLDSINKLYHRQLDESRNQQSNIESLRLKAEGLRTELWKERKSKEDLRAQFRHGDRATNYRTTLSSCSVPLSIPLAPARPQVTRAKELHAKGSKALSSGLQQFLLQLRTDVDFLSSRYRDDVSTVSHSFTGSESPASPPLPPVMDSPVSSTSLPSFSQQPTPRLSSSIADTEAPKLAINFSSAWDRVSLNAPLMQFPGTPLPSESSVREDGILQSSTESNGDAENPPRGRNFPSSCSDETNRTSINTHPEDDDDPDSRIDTLHRVNKPTSNPSNSPNSKSGSSNPKSENVSIKSGLSAALFHLYTNFYLYIIVNRIIRTICSQVLRHSLIANNW